MLTSFDLMLVIITFLIMISGLSKRWSIWRGGRKENLSGNWKEVFGYLLGHRRILENRKPGIAHLIMFWGFAVPLLVIIVAQFGLSIPLVPSLILSLLMDLLGLGLLVSTLFFLVRRLRSRNSEGPKKTILPMIVILIILISGFLAEGSRLSITNAKFLWASPIGWLLSNSLPASPVFMKTMIRIHFFGVLFFIALLPFTFIRHLAAAPLNVFYRRKSRHGELRTIDLDEGSVGAHNVIDFSWKQLLDAEACVSCGRCEENCPAFISGKPLSPRKIIQEILEQMEFTLQSGSIREFQITEDEIWSCTTCMACVEHCPIFIEPLDKIIDIRRHKVMGRGILPPEAGTMLRDLEIFGDVQGKGIAYRTDWALSLSVPLVNTEGLKPEILLWVGCSGSFNPRYQEVSRAMVHILKVAGVSFAILGKDELCCGDPARRFGEESLFLDLARQNIQRLRKYNAEKIVTLCPHCFNTLKNEYPGIDGNTESPENGSWEILHASEYLMTLMREKRISPRYPLDKKVTIHDPCYLGRGNDLYAPPREIIKELPETRFKEMERHHKSGFCCGGGGGGMWLHESLGRRINVIRAEEVVETGVDLLGTACPYCLTMLEDGINSLEMERPPEIKDVIEILASSLF